MNFRKTFSRGLILPVVCAAVLPSGAAAAPVTRTYTYRGTVANACSLSNTSVGFTASRAMGGITLTFTPATVTASCNTASGGILSVASTRLVRQGPNTPQNYQLTVSGWGGAIVYNTAAITPPAATGSKTGLGASTLTFACTNNTCGTNDINQNSTYTATITLGIAANP